MTKVVLSVEEAVALSDALEAYMRLDYRDGFSFTEYRALWDAADKALVPLRGGPYSMANTVNDAGSKVVVSVYLDDGRVYEYDVPTPNKGREHAAAIVNYGYRHTADGEMEHYPPHRILKVKVSGGVETSYPDREPGSEEPDGDEESR